MPANRSHPMCLLHHEDMEQSNDLLCGICLGIGITTVVVLAYLLPFGTGAFGGGKEKEQVKTAPDWLCPL